MQNKNVKKKFNAHYGSPKFTEKPDKIKISRSLPTYTFYYRKSNHRTLNINTYCLPE